MLQCWGAANHALHCGAASWLRDWGAANHALTLVCCNPCFHTAVLQIILLHYGAESHALRLRCCPLPFDTGVLQTMLCHWGAAIHMCSIHRTLDALYTLGADSPTPVPRQF